VMDLSAGISPVSAAIVAELSTRQGKAGGARPGAARLGGARQGKAGVAGQGEARQGVVRRGEARRGKAGGARPGVARIGVAGRGKAGGAWPGEAGIGVAGQGKAGKARHGMARRGKAKQATQSKANIMSSDHNREHTELHKAVRDAIRESGKAAIWDCRSGFDDRTKRAYGLGNGAPDLVGYMLDGTGRFLGIEIKTGAGRLSMEQHAWHRAATDARCIVFVARSVEEALERIR